MTDALESFLSTVDLLSHVGPSTSAAFAAASEVRELDTHEHLFDEGDPGEFLFIVWKGALDAFARSDSGHTTLLRTLGPGQFGGLTSITLDKPRSASLRAALPSTVITVARERVLGLLADCPDLSRSVIAALSSKLRGKTRRLTALLEPRATSRFRIAFYDAKPYERQAFEAHLGEDLACTWLSPRLDPHTAELAAGHQVVCAFVNDVLSRATLARLAQLGVGLVALRCAGFNNVDLPAAAELGIPVVRVPAYSPHAVAEHAMALLLTLNRKTHRAFNRVKEGNFSLTGLVGDDLYGQTAGVIGLGKIGQCCARLFRGFGMTVLAHDPQPDAAFLEDGGVELTSLEELLQRSDVVSLHCPLMPATYHLIDEASIASMKPGVILINTSRGGLVDAKALIGALKSGKISAAGLDVYEEESEYFFEDRSDRVITDDLLARLMTFNNVLITSHQGFLTRQALTNIAQTTLSNIREFASGRLGSALTNVVVAPDVKSNHQAR